jgi:hypothetical protein
MTQEEQYTKIEKEAQKWLDETDTMQFSQMELLTMFAAHVKFKESNPLPSGKDFNCFLHIKGDKPRKCVRQCYECKTPN